MKYNEKIKFKPDQLEYDLQMKKRRNWWWLLLLPFCCLRSNGLNPDTVWWVV